jgi:tetratricopeptide (TPR) repeat protein
VIKSRYSLAISLQSSEFIPVPALRNSIIRRVITGCFFCALLSFQFVSGQNDEEEPRIPWDEAVELFKQGQYESLLPKLDAQTDANPWNDTWWYLKGKTLMTLGRYEEAYETLQNGLSRRTYSISIRLLAIEAAHYNNRPGEAKEHLDSLSSYFSMWARRVRSAQALVELGDVAMQLGVEPRIVLENFYNQAQGSDDAPAEAFSAAGKLAIKKGDYRLGSKHFQSGLELFPEDPDLWYGLASSFLNGDRSELVTYAQQALTLNENHVPSMLLMAEHLIDAEAYSDAVEFLDLALAVNPIHPDALALHAVIAYLENDSTTADLYRQTALASWYTNPNVDYQIGRKLSQKYWFAEGAEAQRRSLEFDPSFVPAKLQLAQDLLRLGSKHEVQGWDLAKLAHDEDPYNVEAFNLVTLSDKLDAFEVIESEHFYLKMGQEEAPVYGQRAMELLERAYTTLSAKYGVELDEKTTVEIYPNPGDFGVRTFGMPGNPGYLGVCFGPVVTVNSPATRQANWESVLWHEFCHTITLKMTRNRMPRWLSEGISVYEELEENPAWGRRMTIDYRERILDREMQAISSMSAAFLQAADDQGVQFAYFQSYLVVNFLFEKFGETAMQKVLHALGKGINTNDALEEHVAPLEFLDRSFNTWARERANEIGGDYELSTPETMLEKALTAMNPKSSYQEALETAGKLIEEENWEEAKTELEALIEDAGYIPGEENAHGMLAYTYQQLEDIENERQTWLTITEHDAHNLDAVIRLLTMAFERDDWKALNRWSNAWLAINPLAETPWRGLLKAGEELNNPQQAIAAGEALVQLDPHDIASVHYRLAKQLIPSDKNRAHRQIIMALEEAPRYRDAYQLLDRLNNPPDEEAFLYGFRVPPVHE